MKAQLNHLSLEQAIDLQFQLVDHIHRNFPDGSFLNAGDLGMHIDGHPEHTALAERTLAGFFHTEDCVLVRGAGTGAIRLSLEALLAPLDTLLIHKAPVYPTTLDTIKHMGLKTIAADYNNSADLEEQLLTNSLNAVLIQHARQLPTDDYTLTELIAFIQKRGHFPIVVDDNYAIFKDPILSTEAGADLSAFSLFKLQGPPGVGCIIGKKEYIEQIRALSGGTQVQGYEALDALRSLVTAPVQLAIQAIETEKICNAIVTQIEAGNSLIKNAFIANMQSRVIMVELTQPIAQKVISCAAHLGASSYPIGAESRYEVPALFYKPSRTFMESHPEAKDTFIRINPMRAGSNTVLRILNESIALALEES